MCIYIYIINIHSTHTYSMYTKSFILDAIYLMNSSKEHDLFEIVNTFIMLQKTVTNQFCGSLF